MLQSRKDWPQRALSGRSKKNGSRGSHRKHTEMDNYRYGGEAVLLRLPTLRWHDQRTMQCIRRFACRNKATAESPRMRRNSTSFTDPHVLFRRTLRLGLREVPVPPAGAGVWRE